MSSSLWARTIITGTISSLAAQKNSIFGLYKSCNWYQYPSGFRNLPPSLPKDYSALSETDGGSSDIVETQTPCQPHQVHHCLLPSWSKLFFVSGSVVRPLLGQLYFPHPSHDSQSASITVPHFLHLNHWLVCKPWPFILVNRLAV